jgi:L-amino acid N-acyltransferase YncA
MRPDMLIRHLLPADWPSVRTIYEEGIATRNATFASSAPDWPDWDAEHLRSCRLVADDAGEVAGWGALTKISNRCVYAGVAEVSVYVASSAQGRGIGRALLSALVAASEGEGLWTLQAGILPENAGSVKIHEHCGFRIVGRREKLGKMDGVWRDVLLLERRSENL